MLFNSYEFIFLFLPVTFFVYFYLNNKRLTEAAKGWLVFSSLFFYCWWDINYLPLILGSILFNYIVSRSLYQYSDTERKGLISRKTILFFGIVLNLSLLGYFKYVDFFIENVNYAFNTQISLLNLTLPLAISFFTFQQIAYLVDSFRQETEEYNFLNYAVFVLFFPQLIAGPIVHHSEMMSQFRNIRKKAKNYRNIAIGLFIFSIGLFKKSVIADSFSEWVEDGFDVAETLNLFEAWATSLSYTFQIYFDFSGYADMAIGSALLFNIKLPINFNSPYKALNIQDFWRRWHMTLSRFLKEYVYIPLGGNRGGSFRTYNNLIATFIIGGIWHGAGWTFVFWGFIHGMAIVINRLWHLTSIKLPAVVAWFITFNFVNVAWVFFRAKEWGDAVKVLTSMFSLDNVVLPGMLKNKLYFLNNYGIEFGGFLTNIQGESPVQNWLLIIFLIVLLVALLIVTFSHNSNSMAVNLRLNCKFILLSSALLGVGIMFISMDSEFLYFNF